MTSQPGEGVRPEDEPVLSSECAAGYHRHCGYRLACDCVCHD